MGGIELKDQGPWFGIWHPRRLPANPHHDDLARVKVLPSRRAVAERTNALIRNTWHALRLIALDPARITEIAAAPLVLLLLQRGDR